jgi:hypothetical protein
MCTYRKKKKKKKKQAVFVFYNLLFKKLKNFIFNYLPCSIYRSSGQGCSGRYRDAASVRLPSGLNIHYTVYKVKLITFF